MERKHFMKDLPALTPWWPGSMTFELCEVEELRMKLKLLSRRDKPQTLNRSSEFRVGIRCSAVDAG